MELLNHIPAILKIFLVLFIIVSAIKLKIPLSFSLIIGCISLAVFFQMPINNFFKATLDGLVSFDTISLVMIVVGILILSNAMSVSGRLNRIVDSFKLLVGESRISLITFPALIGLLPMPGGAIFSAPMVGTASENLDIDPQHKTIINYWFRHIWEYWLPLYPGVILALSLSELPILKFIMLNSPMTIVSLIIGYFVILHHITLTDKIHRNYSKENIFSFIKNLTPILIVILSLLFLGIIVNLIENILSINSKLIIKILEKMPIFIGLIASIMYVFITDKINTDHLKTIFGKKGIFELGLIVIAIMIFRSILENSGGVEQIKSDLTAYHIPLLGIIILLPFVAGLLTGIAVGFVGTSFPVVIALIQSMNTPQEEIGRLIFIAFVFGYLGMMLSPVHLCLLLTKDYFEANLIKTYYRYLIPVCIITALSALLLFSIYNYFNL